MGQHEITNPYVLCTSSCRSTPLSKHRRQASRVTAFLSCNWPITAAESSNPRWLDINRSLALGAMPLEGRDPAPSLTATVSCESNDHQFCGPEKKAWQICETVTLTHADVQIPKKLRFVVCHNCIRGPPKNWLFSYRDCTVQDNCKKIKNNKIINKFF